MAIGAVKLQLVTAKTLPVTAEVASSSLVVPAIHSKPLRFSRAMGSWVQNGATLTWLSLALGQNH